MRTLPLFGALGRAGLTVTWVDGPRTERARVTLDDLTPGTLSSFRYRALTKDGLGDWSRPVTLLLT
jgi:hypothetical protein